MSQQSLPATVPTPKSASGGTLLTRHTVVFGVRQDSAPSLFLKCCFVTWGLPSAVDL